jgi:hypothetical protein
MPYFAPSVGLQVSIFPQTFQLTGTSSIRLQLTAEIQTFAYTATKIQLCVYLIVGRSHVDVHAISFCNSQYLPLHIKIIKYSKQIVVFLCKYRLSFQITNKERELRKYSSNKNSFGLQQYLPYCIFKIAPAGNSKCFSPTPV